MKVEVHVFGEFGFQPWVNLTKKREIENKSLPGVYMIAKSELEPTDYRANNECIIYIGETTDQTLGDRIRQFAVSGFNIKPGHSGGNTFRNKFFHETTESMLWVSVCPVQLGEIYTSTYIKYLERRLIWEFVCAYGTLPACNSK